MLKTLHVPMFRALQLQEATHLATVPFFAHQGMVYVPIGYANPDISLLQDVNGGSPYGASTIAAGDGSRQPTQIELGVAKYQVSRHKRIRPRCCVLLGSYRSAACIREIPGQVLLRVRHHPAQG
jgi:multimeric flavodoxin WrbA